MAERSKAPDSRITLATSCGTASGQETGKGSNPFLFISFLLLVSHSFL